MNKIIVLTGPSGCGKTTLLNAVLEKRNDFKYNITYTTRKPRPGETDGISYMFISEEEFKEKQKNNDFIEGDFHYGTYYGTSKSLLESLLEKKNVIANLNITGAMTFKKLFKEKVVTIFIAPPTIDILKERLRNRKTENPEELNIRLKAIENEYAQAKDCDYILYNIDINETIEKLLDLIRENIDMEENKETLVENIDKTQEEQKTEKKYIYSIEAFVRKKMKENHKKFSDVNFVQDGTYAYQWGQFYKFACKMEYTSMDEINPNLCIIGPRWYMDIQNGEFVYHDEPIAKINKSAAKKTRHGKNPIKILKSQL